MVVDRRRRVTPGIRRVPLVIPFCSYSAIPAVAGMVDARLRTATLAGLLLAAQLPARIAGPDNPLAVPTAAVLGAPFSVSTEAFLPVAASLHQRGMSLGAVFAFAISAAGVNVPELALLARLLRPLLLASYAAAVIAIAITAGSLIPHLLSSQSSRDDSPTAV